MQQRKVLVIDDDEMVLTIVRKLLEAELFTVDVTLSAREALTRLPDTQYNVILCDMWMPGMTGRDFYQQVKRDFPEYQSRIIFLTGDIASEATWDFIEQKRLPYVLKPVNLPELRRKLQEVAGGGPAVAPAKKGAEGRRHKRIAMKALVRVRKKKWDTGTPEIVPVQNASREGVYFMSERQYRIGTEVLVSFPYTGSNDVDQEGVVVRIDERPESRSGVAIAMGEAAAAARGALDLSDEDRARERILSLADMTTAGPARSTRVTEDTSDTADLKLQLARERQASRKLADELSDLQALYQRVTADRDRVSAEESGRDLQLRELTSSRQTMTEVIDHLRKQLQSANARIKEQAESAAAAPEAPAGESSLEWQMALTRERQQNNALADEIFELKAQLAAAQSGKPPGSTSSGLTRELDMALAQQTAAETLQRQAEIAQQKAEAHLAEVQEELEAALDQIAQLRARPMPAPQPALACAPAPSAQTQVNPEAVALRAQVSEMQSRLHELQTAGVGPLTVLAAYCDMLAMNKEFDKATLETIGEISQQAAALRALFQKVLKRT